MCGINGFDWENESLIRKMNLAIKHRGPDDDGVRLGNGVSLGHVRLSIFDLSLRGHQPMSNHDQTIWIVYNGEIYNYKTLKADLICKGYQFYSDTDTEVIIYAYQEYGDAIFEKLNGIFAFALLDLRRNSLLLVRDRLGIKPLYYYIGGQKFIFSSEIKAFQAHQLPLFLDQPAIEEYLKTSNLLSESFFLQIHAVKPGTVVCLDITTRAFSINSYCDVTNQIDGAKYKNNLLRSERQIIDELDQLLNEVVQDQLLSDAPLGSICSGGVDSSLVTAIACRYKKDLKILNVRVTDAACDESIFARKVADHLKLDLIEDVLNKDRYLKWYQHCVQLEDLPLIHPNSVGIFLVSKKARDVGLSVLLCGEGADELFGGYHHYKAYKKRLLLGRFPLFKEVMSGSKRLTPGFNSYLDCEAAPFSVYEKNLGQTPDLETCYMRSRLELLNSFYVAYGFLANNEERRLKTLIAQDMKYYLPPILRRTDRMSLGVGVEMRVPFLDNRLIDFSLNLPVKYQVSWSQSKYILKKVAERYLPKDIVYRAKKGFPLPVDEWLGGAKFQDVMFKDWEEQNLKYVRKNI